MHLLFWRTDDSDDDGKVVRKKGRQVRQAATKAASKQREIILGDKGSEDEEGEEKEEEDDSDVYTGVCSQNIWRTLTYMLANSEIHDLIYTSLFCSQRIQAVMKTSWLRMTMMTVIMADPNGGPQKWAGEAKTRNPLNPR